MPELTALDSLSTTLGPDLTCHGRDQQALFSCPKVRIKEKKPGWPLTILFFVTPTALPCCLCLRSLYSSNTSQNSLFTHGFLTEVLCVPLLGLEGGKQSFCHFTITASLLKNMSVSLAIKETEFENAEYHLYYHLGKHCFKMKLPEI